MNSMNMFNFSRRVLARGFVAWGCFAAAAQALEVGAAAPNCQLKQLTDGQAVSLAQPGKVLYVDFWASWCGPCAQSMPFLEALKNEFQAQGLEVVGVNVDENKDEALAFMKKHPVSFTLAQNEDGQCPAVFEVQAMPSSYLIDRQGKIQHIQLGFHASETGAVREKLQALLNNK